MEVIFECNRNDATVKGKCDIENGEFYIEEENPYNENTGKFLDWNIVRNSIVQNKDSILENLKIYFDEVNVIINYWTFILIINKEGDTEISMQF